MSIDPSKLPPAQYVPGRQYAIEHAGRIDKVPFVACIPSAGGFLSILTRISDHNWTPFWVCHSFRVRALRDSHLWRTKDTMGRRTRLGIVTVFDSGVRLRPQGSEPFLSRRSHEPKEDNPVPRGHSCNLGHPQVGVHVLRLRMDFHLSGQVCFHVLLPRPDPWTIHQGHTVFLDHRRLSCHWLDLCSGQLCSHMCTLWCRRRSVSR